MELVVINYNAGNTQSVAFALERLGVRFLLTDNLEKIEHADKVIFPGVGEASTTMKFLKERKLDQLITRLKQPVLGICLGMQLMCSHSEENNTPCLGIFKDTVKKFIPQPDMKVPHMGWNKLSLSPHSWLDEELDGSYTYFVHSYYVPPNANSSSTTDYLTTFSSAMRKDNFYAVQFHPEKSAQAGEVVMKSFLKQ